MPCNLAARSKASVSNETLTKLILDNPALLANVAKLLAPIVETNPADITAYNDKYETSWNVGWNEYRRGKPVTQIPAEQLVGAEYVDWVGTKCAVRMERNGNITFRGGWDLPVSKYFTPAQSEEKLKLINAALNVALGTLFQQRVKTALAQKFAVESVQNAANGALAITIEI